MNFHLIDLEKWSRKEYFEHYLNDVTCTYSITVTIDITRLQSQKIYPAMLWLLTTTVNEMIEFRTSMRAGEVGYFERMNPSYTIFNKEYKNFSDIWTTYHEDYQEFLQGYLEDTSIYSHSKRFQPKDGRPENTFDVSMLPWLSFTAFNLNIYGSGRYLLPIFTMGKTFETNHRTMMPLAIQIHHAVCDGYHVALFVENLQAKINAFAY